MFLGTVDQHYNRLYNAKYFRNRVLKLQALCSKLDMEAILCVVGKYLLKVQELIPSMITK